MKADWIDGPGSGRDEPHGCVWLKEITGFGEEQTVKVVGNGEGGPKRVWKPATRWSRKAKVRAGAGRIRREPELEAEGLRTGNGRGR
jgi:hypothetical protein